MNQFLSLLLLCRMNLEVLGFNVLGQEEGSYYSMGEDLAYSTRSIARTVRPVIKLVYPTIDDVNKLTQYSDLDVYKALESGREYTKEEADKLAHDMFVEIVKRLDEVLQGDFPEDVRNYLLEKRLNWRGHIDSMERTTKGNVFLAIAKSPRYI